RHRVVGTVLVVDALASLLLVGAVGAERWSIFSARRHGRAGARLHVRIIGLFSVVAAVPAVLVAIVASITLDRGLAPWFTSRIQTVIENSLTVSQIYFDQQSSLIRSEISAMAFDVTRAKSIFDTDRDRFRQFLSAQARLRGLPLTLMVHSDLSVVEKAEIEGVGDIGPQTASGALASVGETEPQVAMFLETKSVAAVVKLRGYDDTYLYVARPLDPRVIEQLEAARDSVKDFANLEARRVCVQIAFALMYTMITLIVLLSAVWIGLNFANRLVAPIRRLIGAANLVSTGNLYVQVPLFTEARSGAHRLVQGQITISREMRERNLSVRVTTEQSPDEDHGYVVTLDDITDLVTAQRTSAWADIARRIAHEIKNPLTPIQLSAERLRRKYARSITDDPAVFLQCTDTIIRQVDDIKRMVDEFSQFARMPKAVIGAEDMADTVRQVVFLQRVGNAD